MKAVVPSNMDSLQQLRMLKASIHVLYAATKLFYTKHSYITDKIYPTNMCTFL
jgi:hypothetical protein